MFREPQSTHYEKKEQLASIREGVERKIKV
jgi:hypothetical protein